MFTSLARAYHAADPPDVECTSSMDSLGNANRRARSRHCGPKELEAKILQIEGNAPRAAPYHTDHRCAASRKLCRSIHVGRTCRCLCSRRRHRWARQSQSSS